LKTDLSTFNNDWYWKNYNSASKAKIIVWYLFNRMFLNTSLPWPMWIKKNLLELFGAKVGDKVVFKAKINIKFPWLLEIGNNVWLGENVWIDNLDWVRIGHNTCVSQGAMLLTGNHNYTLPSFELMTAPIVLEEGVWIGAQAVVCPGVHCLSHSVLAVGSVASAQLDAYHIYRGNPAIKMKPRLK
jgi:putative colanic acid biosynthesis acetyltransferase WcaF